MACTRFHMWPLRLLAALLALALIGAVPRAVTIAVVDTGVNAVTPELQAHVVDGHVADRNGHGTAMAELVARTLSERGVRAFRLLPIPALRADGSGVPSSIAAGIRRATDKGAAVILLSFTRVHADRDVAAAIAYARTHGTYVVAAAGNEGRTGLDYPAAYPGVIAVGAADALGRKAWFSNYGARLLRPGVAQKTVGMNGRPTRLSGTSVAAALAAADLAAGDQAVTRHTDDGKQDLRLSATGNAQPYRVAKSSPPSVTGISPTSGPTIGGTALAILGSQFGPSGGYTYCVIFDGSASGTGNSGPVAATRASAGELDVSTPSHASGLTTVKVLEYVAGGVNCQSPSVALNATYSYGDGVSTGFQYTPSSATHLAFSQQPSNTTAGTSITPAMTAVLLDATNSVVTTDNTTQVTLSFGNNAGGGTLSGTTTVTVVNGIATFSGISIDKTGTGYTLTASSGSLSSATSSTFDITAASASKLAFANQPSNTAAGSVISPNVTVEVQDSYGNIVTSSTAAATVAIGSNPSGGALSGTKSISFVNGVATFNNLAIDKSGVGYTLTATSPGLSGATSTSFNITAGAPDHLAFAQQPSTTQAGASISPAVTVQILDAQGNVATSSSDQITIAIGNNPGGGTLSGTVTVAAVNGLATFSGLSIDKVGTTYTLLATDTTTPTLTSATSSGFDITPGAGTQLAFVQQPTNTAPGGAITPAVTVEVQDSSGNRVTSSSASITVAIGTNPAAGTLSGTLTVSAANGLATFSTLSIDNVGTGYTLTASGAGLTSGTSAAFNIQAGGAAKLRFAQQPTDALAGQTISPAVTVRVEDANGNLVTSSSATISVAISTNPGSGTLSGTLTATAVNGIATFSSLSIDKYGTGYTLQAVSGSLTGVISNSFNISPAAASQLVFSQQPTTTTVGLAISPAVTVRIEDAFGNLATSSAQSVGIAIGTNPGSGTLGGTTTVNAVNGVATFNNLTISAEGNGYTLVASSSGTTNATSNSFNVIGPTQLKFSVQPSDTTSGTAISPSIQVRVEDANGNLVTASNAGVTLSIGTNPGGGTLSGTVVVTAVNGIATFNNIKIDKVGNGYTLIATSGTLTGDASGAFSITAGGAFQLKFSQQPSNSTAGQAISPAITVRVEDAGGNLVTATTQNITLGIGTNPGGGTLSGTTTVATVNGVATFNNLAINKAGTGYTLVATSGTLGADTSGTFDISAGAPAQLAFVQQPTSTPFAQTIQPAVTVHIQDANGNLISNSSASVTIAIGTNPAGGTLSGTLTQVASGGVAIFSDLSIDTVGASYTLTVNSTGLTGGTSSAFDITNASYTIDSILPNSGPAAGGTSVEINGSGFSGSYTYTVYFGGAGPVTATRLSNVKLSCVTPPHAAGLVDVIVVEAGIRSVTKTDGYTYQAGGPAQLAIQQQPTTTIAGAAISPPITIQIQDTDGNYASTATNPVTVAIYSNAGGGVLSGTLTVNAVNGVATFSDLSIDKVGSNYSLVFTSPGLSQAVSVPFNVTFGSPAKLAFGQQPVNTSPNVNFNPPVTVLIEDAYGNVVTNSSAVVNMSIGTNPSSGSLLGGVTVNAVNGVATFDTISIDTAGTGYTLQAASSGLASATSNLVDISVGGPTTLVFGIQPGDTIAGNSMSPAVTVEITDSGGNVVTTSSATVTITIANNPGGGTLSGTASVAAVSGVATFSNLSINKAGVGYTLSAASSGLLSATSTSFNISAGAAATLVFVQQPSDGTVGVAMSPAPTVQLRDAFGNDVAAGGVSVALSLASGTAGLSGTSATTDSTGLGTFASFSLDTAGTYTLSANSSGLTSATSSSFVISNFSAGFNVIETSAAAGTTVGPLNTKIAGVAFTVRVVALSNSGTTVNTTYGDSVQVKLLDASSDSGSLDSNNCRSSWTTIQTLTPAGTFSNGTQDVTFTENTAWRVARIEVVSTTGTYLAGCSNDAFAIRPASFSTVSSNMNNTGTSGLPVAKVGTQFSITAVAGAGYSGTPKFDSAKVAAFTGAPKIGTLTGTFNPANSTSGTSTGSAFAYSEVGAFQFQADGIYDDTFTAVDQPSGCSNDFSNTVTGGLVGCKFGNPAASSLFGRFTPDHFDVTVSDGCTGGAGFTYSAQAFTVTVTARDAGGAVTQDYANNTSGSTYAQVTTFSVGGNAANLTNNVLQPSDFSNGVGVLSTPTYTFPVKNTAPTGIAMRATDADNVSSVGHTEQSTQIRSGRLAIANGAVGELYPLNVAVTLETYREYPLSSGTYQWVVEPADTCTTLSSSSFQLQGATGGVGSVTLTGPNMSSGTGTLTLSAPGLGNGGQANLADSTTPLWLQFDWNNTGSVAAPVALVQFFSTYEGEKQRVYMYPVHSGG